MLKVSPFQGIRFASRRVPLAKALCPPYDVIAEGLARRLRKFSANAIHVELPAGVGTGRYRKAARLWRRWLREGILVQDDKPSFYAVEQTFSLFGRRFKRTGLLAALGLDSLSAKRVLRHERTLAKPKKDRAKLLRSLGVNTSPIFGIFTDPSRRVRAILASERRRAPLASGTDAQKVSYRLWRVDDPGVVRRLEAAFRTKRLLIADGHHRYEVARANWLRTGASAAGRVLAYLCAEEDSGLVVLPTHRVLGKSGQVTAALRRHCVLKRVRLGGLEKALAHARSPYAFGLYNGDCRLALPAPGDRGVASRFGSDWLAKRVLKSVDAQEMRYFHDVDGALRCARSLDGWAFVLKPFSVADIRRAVESSGLLPQKSTYFYPKIATGLVFRAL